MSIGMVAMVSTIAVNCCMPDVLPGAKNQSKGKEWREGRFFYHNGGAIPKRLGANKLAYYKKTVELEPLGRQNRIAV